MNPVVGAALVTGGANLLTSGLNMYSTYKTNQQQYQYNKDLAEQAFRNNVAMWNMQNAYNTPSAQMARMAAAGLNPNLIYGNGSDVSAGNAGTAPQLQYGQYNPQVPVFDLNSPIKNAISMYMLQAQKDNLEADTGLKTQQSKTEVRRQEQIGVQCEQMKANIANLNVDTKSKEILNSWADRMYEAQVRQMDSASALNDSQKRQIEYKLEHIMPKEVVLKDKEIENYNRQWEVMQKEIEHMAAQIAKTDAERELLIRDLQDYALNHMQRGWLGTGLSVPNLERSFRQTKLFKFFNR